MLATTKEHVDKDTGNAVTQSKVAANKSTENTGNGDTRQEEKSENQPARVKYNTKEEVSTKLKTVENVTDEILIQEDPKDQQCFDLALKFTCKLLKAESLLKAVNKNVTKLHLSRTLPLHFSLHQLLSKFENLKVSDASKSGAVI